MNDTMHTLSRSMPRRRLLKAGVGGAALAGAAGLVPGLGRGRAAAQDVTTLRFWTPGGSPTFCEVHQEIADDYAALNPNVRFEPVQCGTGNSDDYAQVLLASIAAGNPPDATILWDSPVSLGARGALTPLDELMASSEHAALDKWPAGLLASCQFGDVTYGLPVTAGLYGIWYNADMFEAKGIPNDPASLPKTWDELRQLSKEFTVWDGDNLAVAGFIPNNALFDAYVLPIWSALNGGQLYDAENQVYTIDSDANVEMMEYFVSWIDDEYKGDINAVRAAGSWNAYASDEGLPPAFQEGRQAMLQQGSWVMGDIDSVIEPVFTNWNIGNHPVGPSGSETISGYWPNWLVIPQGAANPEAMFGYLDYMSGVGVEKWFNAVVDIPTNADAPDVLPQTVVESRGEEFAQEIMAFWAAQAEIATPMWNSPVQSFANDRLGQAVEQIFTKAAAPKGALAEAQQACQAELASTLAELD